MYVKTTQYRNEDQYFFPLCILMSFILFFDGLDYHYTFNIIIITLEKRKFMFYLYIYKRLKISICS